MLSTFNEEDRRRLMECYVFGGIKGLPKCSTAAIAHLARLAEVFSAPACDNPECDHVKLPEGFGQYAAVGTPVGSVIAEIQSFVRQREVSAPASAPVSPEQ